MFITPVHKRPLELTSPDYVEKRDQRFLLLWRDVPHWMVVDGEMKEFLYLFSKQQSFSDVLQNNVHLNQDSKELLSVVKDLHQKNILRNVNRSNLQGKADNSSIPIENVAWNLTHKCNLCCRYCYYADSLNHTPDRELSADEVITFLKIIKPFLSKQATLTILGGEPLLDSEKLIEVCTFAKKNRINPLISTNGTLINSRFSKKAKQIKLEVQVSLDGPNAAMNDPLRGQGTFEKIREGVKILQSHGVHTILSMVCCRSNFDSLKDFLNLAIKWGVQEARFIPLKQMGGATTDAIEMVSHYEIITRAYQLIKDHVEYRKLLGRDCLSILASTCRYSSRRQSCGTGLQTLLLDADGRLYPCLNMNLKMYQFGHVLEPSFDFSKIWEKSFILDDVRDCTSVFNQDRLCTKCPVKHWCLGGCRGETVVNTGDLKVQSIHCGDLRKTLIEIMWILSQDADILNSQ